MLPYVRIRVFLRLFLRYEKERTTDKDRKTAQKQIAEINHNLPPSAFKNLNCLGLHFDFSSIDSPFRSTALIFLTSTFNSKYEYANTLIDSDNRYRQGVIFESEDKPIGEFKISQKFIISRWSSRNFIIFVMKNRQLLGSSEPWKPYVRLYEYTLMSHNCKLHLFFMLQSCYSLLLFSLVYCDRL